MDKSIITSQLSIISKHYPDLDITQLGLVVLTLGYLRSTMGHEHAQGTIENYIHQAHLSEGVRYCLEYIEREVLGTRKSKIDIDLWKFGNKESVKRE